MSKYFIPQNAKMTKEMIVSILNKEILKFIKIHNITDNIELFNENDSRLTDELCQKVVDELFLIDMDCVNYREVSEERQDIGKEFLDIVKKPRLKII